MQIEGLCEHCQELLEDQEGHPSLTKIVRMPPETTYKCEQCGSAWCYTTISTQPWDVVRIGGCDNHTIQGC